MGFFSPPKPTPPPPAPTQAQVDAESEAAAEEKRRKVKAQQVKTILTSGQGLAGPQGSKSILGGG